MPGERLKTNELGHGLLRLLLSCDLDAKVSKMIREIVVQLGVVAGVTIDVCGEGQVSSCLDIVNAETAYQPSHQARSCPFLPQQDAPKIPCERRRDRFPRRRRIAASHNRAIHR